MPVAADNVAFASFWSIILLNCSVRFLIICCCDMWFVTGLALTEPTWLIESDDLIVDSWSWSVELRIQGDDAIDALVW